MAEKQISQWNVTYRQRWEVMKYKYSIWVLKWIFQVFVLYLSICYSDDFLPLLPKFVHKFVDCLLLALENHACFLFSRSGS